jgi:hypothetical protein
VIYYQTIISRKQEFEQLPKQKALCFYTDGKLFADILSYFVISQADLLNEKQEQIQDLAAG